MISLALLLSALAPQELPVRPGAGKDAGEIRTFPAEVPICPDGFGDCRLTVVERALCSWLAEMFDPLKDSYHDSYNCLEGSRGVYVCLNVMTKRKIDANTGAEYIDPHLLELASLYESQLDECLPGWVKSKSMADAGPALLYENRDRLVLLSVIPYSDETNRYHRLTLNVRLGR